MKRSARFPRWPSGSSARWASHCSSSSTPAMNSEVPIQRSSRILTLPNVLTILRLCCIPLVLLFMWENDLRWALLLFLAAGVTDFFDGLTARLLRQQSMLGMYLDPIADKLLLSSSFLVLARTGQIPWIVSGMVLARDAGIIIICLVLMATRRMRRFPPSFLGKVNT